MDSSHLKGYFGDKTKNSKVREERCGHRRVLRCENAAKTVSSTRAFARGTAAPGASRSQAQFFGMFAKVR